MYTITLSNGNILTAVPDTQLVSSYGGLNLTGKNYVGYGTILDNNIVHMTENFADSTPPTNPLIGQIWFDTVSNVLNFWSGTQFKAISVITNSATAPLNPQEGDEWYDNINQQLNLWNGTAWIVIGPINQGGVKEGFIVQSLQTNNGNIYYLDLYANNELLGIVSSVTLTNPDIVGFGNIRPGLNFVTNPESAPSIIESGIYNASEITLGNADQITMYPDTFDNAIVEVAGGNVMIATNSTTFANIKAFNSMIDGNIEGTVYFNRIIANSYGNLPATSSPGISGQIIYNNGTSLAGSNAITVFGGNITASVDHLLVNDEAVINANLTVNGSNTFINGTIYAANYENLPPFSIPGSSGQFLYNDGSGVGAASYITLSGTTINISTLNVVGNSTLNTVNVSSTLRVTGISTLGVLNSGATDVNLLVVENTANIKGSTTLNYGTAGQFSMPTTNGIENSVILSNGDGTTTWSNVSIFEESGSNVNGHWVMLPFGLIMQWNNSVLSGGVGGTNFTFPIPFTNAASINIQVSEVYTSGASIIPNVTSGSITTTGFNGGGSGSSHTNINWYAIGF
jgi:hypothetical protein